MQNLNTETITSYPHTRRTLQVETGTAEKTVRRWIKKADVTGQPIDGVERFTDEQRDLILSFRAQPKTQAVEAEIVTGNHRATSAISVDVQSPVNLARFRGNATTHLATVEGGNLDRLGELALRVSEAIDDDLAMQAENYAATQEQIDRARAIQAQLERKALKYEIQSELRGELQTQKSSELTSVTADLSNMLRGQS